VGLFVSLLQHPLTVDMDPDDPRTTLVRRRIVREKPFLRKLYIDWYSQVSSHLPGGDGKVLEVGSGPGFQSEYIPGLLTSEILPVPNVQMVLDAQVLPFRKGSLRGIVMTDVLHHIPRPAQFLQSAAVCMRQGGRIVMVEPWRSAWSQLVYTRIHPEPFVPSAGWEIPSGGPLSGANGALPWIIFERDYARFSRELHEWSIVRIQPMMPFRYLASGGVSMRSLMPGWSYSLWRTFDEVLLRPLHGSLAMFALIVLERRPV
jgi:SAM-dependent methyltransferase